MKDLAHLATWGARELPEYERLPTGAELVRQLGVGYVHIRTRDRGDLYLTRYGLPFLQHLMPSNWYAGGWFRQHRERLKGTSTVYRLPTRPIEGRSLELVVKWSRVGQDVPIETKVLENMLNAEFNSPFEEFALVEELRSGRYGSPDIRLLTHRPLAIYAPPDRFQLWQTGRSKEKINRKIRKHPGVELDILRQYIMIYEWIKGIDAAEAFEQLQRPTEDLHQFTADVIEHMRLKGFEVADMKPAHMIVRKTNDGFLLRRRGEIAYALVDFELLRRTPQHEEEIARLKRAEYLKRQRDRFSADRAAPMPVFLRRVNIMDVEYISGHVESTGGHLWVVGKDAGLFDFFQPERWRKTRQRRLSDSHQVFYTRTKDNVHLVWKTSRVGERPEPGDAHEDAEGMIGMGFNSPFEEFAYAMELNRRGVPTTYPRAIYMTGSRSEHADVLVDRRRFSSHRGLRMAPRMPILRPDHDYIKIWGFWNGPDELLATRDDLRYRSLDARRALNEGLLNEQEVEELVLKQIAMLADAGFEAVSLAGHHLLLSIDSAGNFVRDRYGDVEIRLCNFEFVRPLPGQKPAWSDRVIHLDES